MIAQFVERDVRYVMLNETITELARLNEARGFEIAVSAKNEAVALLGLNRVHEARRAAQRGLDLAPGDFGLWDNLAQAQAQIPDLEAAEKSLLRCLELQPASRAARNRMLRVLLMQTRFDDAQRWIESGMRFRSGPRGDIDRSQAEGSLLLFRAFELLSDEGKRAECANLAREARAKLILGTRQESFDTLVCLAMENPGSVSAELIVAIARDPLNWYQLHVLSRLLPLGSSGLGLDGESVSALRKLFIEQSRALAPGQSNYNK